MKRFPESMFVEIFCGGMMQENILAGQTIGKSCSDSTQSRAAAYDF